MRWSQYIHSRAARRGSYAALLLALVLLLVGEPLLELAGIHGRFVISAFFVLALVACLAAAFEESRGFSVLIATGIAVEFLTYFVAPAAGSTGHVLHQVARLALSVLLLVVLMRDIVRARRITTDTILGAISIYLLLGVAFAHVFLIVELVEPGSFLVHGAAMTVDADARLTRTDLSYFSFVTLTSLGYGDIVPAGGAAKALAGLEAAFGQLYIAIVVARLVAMGLTQPPRSETEAP